MSRFAITAALAGFLLAAAAPDQIPRKVMDALQARFPKAEVVLWTVEKEDGVTVHDIEFRQDGRKFEADIAEDGTIRNWERQVPPADLPAAARKAVERRYRAAAIREVMAITAVKDGKETPEGYEVTLETAGKKTAEITVAPDGKILEQQP